MRTLETVLIAMVLLSWPINGLAQDANSPEAGDIAVEPTDNELPPRQRILQSPRWRRLERSIDGWLSIQSIYTDQQITKLKSDLKARVATMTPRQLADFIYDTEERLSVLMSDDAQDARRWLSVLTMDARQRKVAPGGAVPNAFEIDVSQLREELGQFQKRRAQGAAAHQAFTSSREQQVESALEVQRSQQRKNNEVIREIRSNTAALQHHQDTFRTPYTPRADPSSLERQRYIYVNPWGGVSFRFGL